MSNQDENEFTIIVSLPVVDTKNCLSTEVRVVPETTVVQLKHRLNMQGQPVAFIFSDKTLEEWQRMDECAISEGAQISAIYYRSEAQHQKNKIGVQHQKDKLEELRSAGSESTVTTLQRPHDETETLQLALEKVDNLLLKGFPVSAVKVKGKTRWPFSRFDIILCDQRHERLYWTKTRILKTKGQVYDEKHSINFSQIDEMSSRESTKGRKGLFIRTKDAVIQIAALCEKDQEQLLASLRLLCYGEITGPEP